MTAVGGADVATPRRRILVAGAGGYLGAHLMARLARSGTVDVVGTCRPGATDRGLVPVDLTDPGPTLRAMRALAPDAVVWCAKAGARPSEAARARDEEGLLAGLDAVLEGLGATARLVYVSSDGVLPGVGAPHDESAVPVPMASSLPLAAYTNAKLEGEERVRGSGDRHLVVRVGPLYGRGLTGAWDGRTTALRDAWRSDAVVERATNVVRTFLHVEDAAAALAELCRTDRAGTLHLGPKLPASHFAFALATARRLGVPSARVRPVTVTGADAERRGVRLDTSLDTGRARTTLATSFRPVGDVGDPAPAPATPC